MAERRPVVKLRFEYDTDTDSPLEEMDGMWTLYWGRSEIERFFSDRGSKTLPDTLDLFFKLRNGLAWIVNGYTGSGHTNLYVDDYDPEDILHGLLVWENKPEDMGAKTREERRKDANNDLKIYNLWANGEVYGYIWEAIEYCTAPEFGDSLWNLLGYDNPCEAVEEQGGLPERCLIVAEGDLAEHFAPYYKDWSPGIDVITWKEWNKILIEREEQDARDDAEEDGSEWEGVV